jgi:uncharacterized delta-60 repeat protein
MLIAVGLDWTVARHRANGAIDTTFKNDPKAGTGGAFSDTFTYGGGSTLFGGGLVVQPDNKILVAGSVPVKKVGGSQQYVMGVVRYQANGRDDTTFGSNGLVTLTGLGTSYKMRGIAFQPNDGKIILLGGGPSPSYDSLIVVRLMPDGKLDTTFGTGGVFEYSPGVKVESAAVAVQTVSNEALGEETRAVISGTVEEAVGHKHPFLLRLTNTGSGLDTTFGEDGIALSEVPGVDSTYYQDIAFDSQNRIVVGGYTTDGLNTPSITQDMVVARFTEDGWPDGTFNNGSGVFTQRWAQGSTIYGIAVQPDDKILAVGAIPYPGLAAVWRLGAYGTLDTSFGSGGLATQSGQFYDVTLVDKPGGPAAFVTVGRGYPGKGGSTGGVWSLWRYFY